MQPETAFWISGVIAGIATAVSAPLAVRFLQARKVVDDPNHRSSHARPVVRGAGIAMAVPAALATIVTAGSEALPVIITAVLLAALGLADDFSSRPASMRFVAQMLAGAGLGLWVLTAEGAWLAAATFVFCCGYVNAVNFMDGINGITGLHATVAGVCFGVIGVVEGETTMAAAGAALAGSGIGFLPVNFPTARAFPGDAGSYLVGGWIAGLVALGLSSGLSLLVVGAPAVIYVADTGIVVVRRALRGEKVTEPHRQHVYQRLVDAGHAHAPVALMVAGFTASSAVATALAAERIGFLVLTVLLAALYIFLPAIDEARSSASVGNP